MREHRFRAWNGEIFFYYSGIFNRQPYVERSTFPQYESIREYPDLSIMESTGLKDNNGKEIFEGDIVKAWIYSDETPVELQVYYSGSGFVIDYHDSEADCFYISEFPGSISVIGNIYEEGGKD